MLMSSGYVWKVRVISKKSDTLADVLRVLIRDFEYVNLPQNI